MTLRYWLIIAVIGAAFGASFALNEVLLASFDPLTVSLLRVGVGAAGCWAWVLATGRRATFKVGLLVTAVVFGVFQFAAPFAILPLAQQHISSSTAGIANAMTPVATVLLSHVWPGGEQATRQSLLGVTFGLIGITVLASHGPESGEAEPLFVLFAICAPVCYATALNIARRFAGLDPVVVTAWAMTGAVLVMAPAALGVDGMPAVPDARTVMALLVVGLGLTSATFIAMYTILPVVGATNLSLVTFVAPLSATVIGALAFNDVLGARHSGGMVLILAGMLTIDGRLVRTLAASRSRAIRFLSRKNEVHQKDNGHAHP
jgi:drug/metabolite transporter (DMT)-like permease